MTTIAPGLPATLTSYTLVLSCKGVDEVAEAYFDYGVALDVLDGLWKLTMLVDPEDEVRLERVTYSEAGAVAEVLERHRRSD